ncbi:MAG TPA: ATP-binding protein, partial [Candidatus Kapabacteria bacterium]|nr:ATP-binding protein [Candidatus Kapabacteria bacterium]
MNAIMMLDILRKYNFWSNEAIKTGYFRESYTGKIAGYLNNKLVKVILGQRRVGKSYLLRMIISHLIEKEAVPRKNILYINKDIAELDFINSNEVLLTAVNGYRAGMKPEGKVYIFLDEVQEIKGWEKVVNSFSQDYTSDYEVFVTGSNANLLSTELSTYLSGRYICFEVFPFSYEEYAGFKGLEKNRESFMSYLKNGGIPESCNFEDMEIKKNYLLNLKDSIVLKDIVRRHNVRDVYLLEKLLNFMIDSIGSLFSVNSVVNHLKSSGYKANGDTIGNYIGYLKEAYFFHEVDRFDIKGKRILSGEKKYYLNDLGFKYFLSSSFEFGVGKYLENLVYLDLRRKGYKIYSGTFRDKEIDFIAEKDNMKKYIQVCYLLADESVVEREFGNLASIDDHFEKIVVSLDELNLGNRNGIVHRNAWEFISL